MSDDDPVLVWLINQRRKAVDEAVKAEDAKKRAEEAVKEAEYALTAAEEAVKEAKNVVLSAYLDVKNRDQLVQEYLQTIKVEEPAPPEPLPPFEDWGPDKTERRLGEYRLYDSLNDAMEKWGKEGIKSKDLAKKMDRLYPTVTSYLTQAKRRGGVRHDKEARLWYHIPPEKRPNGAGKRDDLFADIHSS